MDKITVLISQKDILSENIECVPIGDKIFDCEKVNKYIYDEPSMFPSPKKYVDITDEEFYNKACEYAMAKYGALHQVSQRAELRNAYLEAYEYIKSRINQ